MEDRIYTVNRSRVVRAFSSISPFDRLTSEDIELPDPQRPCGICASVPNVSLFVIATVEKRISRIVFPQKTIQSWTLTFFPQSISVSSTNDLLVLGYDRNIDENHEPIKQPGKGTDQEQRSWSLQVHQDAQFHSSNPLIRVPDEFSNPIHAVQSSRRTFFIPYEHEQSAYRIGEISGSGAIRNFPANHPLTRKWDQPVFLDIDENDVLFVCECDTNSVALLDTRPEGSKTTMIICQEGESRFMGICYARNKQLILVGLKEPGTFVVYSLCPNSS